MLSMVRHLDKCHPEKKTMCLLNPKTLRTYWEKCKKGKVYFYKGIKKEKYQNVDMAWILLATFNTKERGKLSLEEARLQEEMEG